MRLRILVLATIGCIAPTLLFAQAVNPMTASQAEGAAQWDEAIRLHREAIAADPGRSDLWVRIADIEARRGNLAASVTALEQAVAASPASAPLYARLSQAYATSGSALAALRAIDGALALKPREPEYLRAKATLATWAGDYRGAQDSYQQLALLYSTDLEIALALGRVSAWSGDTDQAVKQYKRYLKAESANPEVWLELAKAESWRGNYAGAIEALDTYGVRVGKTEKYQSAMATVLANAGEPTKAESLVRPLLAQSPENVELNLIHATALARQGRTREAFESLETVRKLSPGSPETHTAERVLRTLLSSSAESPFTVYGDSDDLQVQRFAPRATFALTSGAQFSGGYEISRLDARAGSGLEGIDGSSVARYEHLWAGAGQRFGSVTVNGQVGYATAATQTSTTYAVGFNAWLTDDLRVSMSRTSAPLVVSPRTVDLGLTAASHRAQIDWTAASRYHLAFDATAQNLSDGNRRWEVTIAPRLTLSNRARFNLDLGATAYRLETSHDFNHGYYDPRRYEYYAATMYPYFKIGEDVGLAMTVAMGAQRDYASPSFHFGGNVGGEATFGIYSAWVLKVNGSATQNGRLDSGAFRGFGGGAALVRRF